ncbi:MAG: hypothetical protein H0V66_14910 [Bdellovibrionales bacterium]|nr:hypothetical protein [Bdellovibrionales bacterium]
MILKYLLALILAGQPLVSKAADDFTFLNIKSSSPANIRIDFKVDNPDKTRAVKTKHGTFESRLDFKKIKISENNFPLSNSEGGKAIIGGCTECSVNVIHLTLDYSGSVRGQQDNLINSALSFLSSISKSSGKKFVRISLFAGDKGLFNFRGFKNYYFDPATLSKKLSSSSCNDFSLNGDNNGLSLCNADSATRLNRAIVSNITELEESKKHFVAQSPNANYTSIVFSDGMGRDLDVGIDTVVNKIESFKNDGGLFYVVALKSDEKNKKYFEDLGPSKIFTLKKISNLSESLVNVFDEMQANLPLFFTIKICSAVRGGISTLGITSKEYHVPVTTQDIDATDFTGGCDVNNNDQWKF